MMPKDENDRLNSGHNHLKLESAIEEKLGVLVLGFVWRTPIPGCPGLRLRRKRVPLNKVRLERFRAGIGRSQPV